MDASWKEGFPDKSDMLDKLVSETLMSKVSPKQASLRLFTVLGVLSESLSSLTPGSSTLSFAGVSSLSLCSASLWTSPVPSQVKSCQSSHACGRSDIFADCELHDFLPIMYVKRAMYQRKVHVDMLNAVRCVANTLLTAFSISTSTLR